jgi:hypothetical protein
MAAIQVLALIAGPLPVGVSSEIETRNGASVFVLEIFIEIFSHLPSPLETNKTGMLKLVENSFSSDRAIVSKETVKINPDTTRHNNMNLRICYCSLFFMLDEEL